jgi:hypothetical protein
MLNMQNLDRLACLTGSLAKYVSQDRSPKCDNVAANAILVAQMAATFSKPPPDKGEWMG